MTSEAVAAFLSSLLASGVEFVEALTGSADCLAALGG
jgi:hypothetical protein